jgi:calcium-dependent protein kinase
MGSELGAGAFGTVYQCIHKETGNIRACKKIPKKEMKSQDMSKVWTEMKILKQLDHPNIIKTYEYFQDELHFYIVTDYCEGGELFDRIISKHQFSENSACKVVKQILSAICYCHKKNLVHRDLKPENIIFDKASDVCDEIKVIDFGNR